MHAAHNDISLDNEDKLICSKLQLICGAKKLEQLFLCDSYFVNILLVANQFYTQSIFVTCDV